MSRRGNCWDNAVAESFFASLKKERIKKRIYKNRELATADVSDYIESFYNRTRRHRHLAKRESGSLRIQCETRVTACPWNPGNSTSPLSAEVRGAMREVL